jgi:hypothetical protein
MPVECRRDRPAFVGISRALCRLCGVARQAVVVVWGLLHVAMRAHAIKSGAFSGH